MAMNEMKPDEMTMLKAVAIKIDDTNVLLATFQYHVEKNPDTGKNDRSKSAYRWLARVQKLDVINEAAKTMMQDANRLSPWKWPNDPTWNGKILTSDSNQYAGSKFLTMKIKKLVDWDLGQKILNGWKKCKSEYNLKAKYEIDGYTAPDGSIVSLSDKAALLKHVGENLIKNGISKTSDKTTTAA